MERPKFHLPESVTAKAHNFFSHARRLKEQVGDNKLDVSGWGLVAASLPNAALGFIKGGVIGGAMETTFSLGMLCSGDNVLHSTSKAEKIWSLTDGSLATLGALGFQSGIQELFYPSLIVGAAGTLSSILHFVTANDHPISINIT